MQFQSFTQLMFHQLVSCCVCHVKSLAVSMLILLVSYGQTAISYPEQLRILKTWSIFCVPELVLQTKATESRLWLTRDMARLLSRITPSSSEFWGSMDSSVSRTLSTRSTQWDQISRQPTTFSGRSSSATPGEALGRRLHTLSRVVITAIESCS